MSKSYDERRFKIMRIDPELLMFIFGQWKKGPQFIQLPTFSDVPEGFEIHDAQWNWDMRCFSLRISHESFEPVPDGAPPPYIERFGKVVTYERLSDHFAPQVQVIQYMPGQSEDVKRAMREVVNRYGPEMFMPRVPEVVWAVPNGDSVIADIQETTEKIEKEHYIGLNGDIR